MRISIDIRVLARGTRTGIEEYVLNLLPRLLSMNPPTGETGPPAGEASPPAGEVNKKIKYKLFYNAFRKVKLNYSWLDPNVELRNFRLPNRLLNFFVLVFKWPKINKFLGPPVGEAGPPACLPVGKAGEAGKIDIFFSPHFLPVSLSRNCKRVITFHDLSFEHYPQFLSYSRKLWHFLTFPKQQAEKADKIIVDSQSTKEDLIKIYNINSEKIKLVYLGVNDSFKPIGKNDSQIKKVRKKYKLPEKFILYFGTIEPRKNLFLTIRAFEALREKFGRSGPETGWKGFEGTVIGKKKNTLTDLKLVIAGSKGWLYKDIFKMVKNSKYREDIIFTGFIDDKDKPHLYNLADVFLYPSFFEGFGFPPLEAMACGVPTIVSNVSSLPEVVGNSAVMISPYNVDELTFAIREILEDKNLREDLIKNGLKQARKFDWGKTAKEVLKIFYEIKK